MAFGRRSIIHQCNCGEFATITLMEPHDSQLYNPDIANVFYRTGFIENWGQGIKKICDECRKIGADIPNYELIGKTLCIHFRALESTLINDSKTPEHHGDALDVGNGGKNVGIDVGNDGKNGGLAGRIIDTIREEPQIRIVIILTGS